MISDLVSLPNEAERAVEQQIRKARADAVTWLGIEKKSSGRVTDYLARQGYDPDVVKSALISLQEDGTVDDVRIARRLVRQRQGRQAESALALVRRMRQLGLDQDAIDAVMPEHDDCAAASDLLELRFGRLFDELTENDNPTLTGQKARQSLVLKAARFLSGRGFDSVTIVRALRKYEPGIDSLD